MISIIIPTYNTQKYISETIQSVIDQTLSDWELIIIDDGSTDNTVQIVEEFKKRDTRIKYYYQENAGVSAARNKGIELSKGEFIAFLDADDIWLPKNLEKKIESIENNVEVFWAFSNIIHFTESSEVIDDKITDANNLEWLGALLLWNAEVKTTPGNIVLKRECCTKGGLRFDENFSTAADQDFCIQLAAKYKGKCLKEALVRYRVLENSMSRNIKVMEKDHIAVYKKALKRGLFKNFWFKQKCFANLYLILAGSWWKDGNNKWRGFFFMFKALVCNPFIIVPVLKRKFKCSGV